VGVKSADPEHGEGEVRSTIRLWRTQADPRRDTARAHHAGHAAGRPRQCHPSVGRTSVRQHSAFPHGRALPPVGYPTTTVPPPAPPPLPPLPPPRNAHCSAPYPAGSGKGNGGGANDAALFGRRDPPPSQPLASNPDEHAEPIRSIWVKPRRPRRAGRPAFRSPIAERGWGRGPRASLTSHRSRATLHQTRRSAVLHAPPAHVRRAAVKCYAVPTVAVPGVPPDATTPMLARLCDAAGRVPRAGVRG
jgi:hypothetical protein